MLRARDESALASLSPAERALFAEYEAQLRANPLFGFSTRRNPKQAPFLDSRARVQAYFGGNGSGKTTALVVKTLAQVLDAAALPERLRSVRRREVSQIQGRLLCSSFKQMHTVLLPKFRELAPAAQLRGGSFDKAFDKTNFILRLENGSWVDFATYDQDVQKLAGADFDFVGYDEPPPFDHRVECRARLRRSSEGFEMFTLTPTEGIGDFLFEEIWEPFESGVLPDDTFVAVASTDDNGYIDDATKAALFPEALSAEQLQARRHGRFVALHGRVYDRFDPERHVIPSAPLPELADVFMVIDPGIQFMCAVLFAYVDVEGRLVVFDEVPFENGEAIPEISQALHLRIGEHGRLPRLKLIDPAAQNRANQTGRNDQEAFAEHGHVCVPANNLVAPGINRVKARLDAEPAALLVMAHCTRLLREFKLYRWRGERPKADAPQDDRRSRPVKRDDHFLDCLRYVCMAKPYAPSIPAVADPRSLQERAVAAALAAPRRALSHPEGPGVFA